MQTICNLIVYVQVLNRYTSSLKGGERMTLKQEAHGLIDTLPDDCIKIIIRLMYKMEPSKAAAVRHCT